MAGVSCFYEEVGFLSFAHSGRFRQRGYWGIGSGYASLAGHARNELFSASLYLRMNMYRFRSLFKGFTYGINPCRIFTIRRISYGKTYLLPFFHLINVFFKYHQASIDM